MLDTSGLHASLRAVLDGAGALEARLQQAVVEIARAFAARTCTFHEAEGSESFLRLRAQVGLPPHILEVTRRIPVGKGMAGICAERKQPVTVCNLQTDDSGVARPAARDTKVAGALVVPVLEGECVRATLGIGKAEDHDYSPDEVRALEDCGALLVRYLS
jgi:signal transduction protein with GAF and PtsI domain